MSEDTRAHIWKNVRKTLGAFLILGLQAFAAGGMDAGTTGGPVSLYGKAEAATTLDVRTYGAKGNGSTNDTTAIQNAVNALGSAGGTVVIPPGTYLIDAVKSINLKNNVTLQMTPTTVLKTIANSSDWSAVVQLKNVSYANVNSGVLIGDRYSHLSTGGEHGMGVSIFGASNVVITGTTAKDMWGDGFWIGPQDATAPRNIQLIDIVASNNRRQGLTLTSGVNVTIVRASLTKTNGGNPGYGMDIEPNKLTDKLQNIVLTDVYTANNDHAGIGMNLSRLEGTTTPVSITINNHVDDGSQRGFASVHGVTVPGSVTINNPVWKNNKLNGFAITNHDYHSYKILVNNPQVVNCNATGSTTSGTSGSAYAMYNISTSRTIGNIYLYNPTVTDTRSTSRTVSGFYVYNANGKAAVNLSIVRPIINGTVKALLKANSTGVKIQ